MARKNNDRRIVCRIEDHLTNPSKWNFPYNQDDPKTFIKKGTQVFVKSTGQYFENVSRTGAYKTMKSWKEVK